MDGERFEEHQRRLLAEVRRRELLAQAAARRAEARERRRKMLAMTAARQAERREPVESKRAHMRDWLRLAARSLPGLKPKRRPRPDLEDGGVPVSPDRPRNLTGGAAAALDFENE